PSGTYTLSLRDALPISPPVAAGQEAGVRRGTRGQRRGVGGTAPGAHHPVPAAALVVVPDGGHRRGSARTRPPRVGTGTHPCVSRDRKSTRLNSSHVKIS